MPATFRTFSVALLPIVATALAVGSMSGTPAQAATTSTAPALEPQQTLTATYQRPSRVDRALAIMRNQQGDRYRYGAAGPNAFDCSGLVYYATRRAGFDRVPRTSSQQARFMDRVSRKRMRPGDFVFFTGRSGVYHVGFYAGRRDGRRVVLHAPSTGSRVRTEAIWTDRWFAGTLR